MKSTYPRSGGQPTAGVGEYRNDQRNGGVGSTYSWCWGVYKSQDLGSTYIAADENYLS